LAESEHVKRTQVTKGKKKYVAKQHVAEKTHGDLTVPRGGSLRLLSFAEFVS